MGFGFLLVGYFTATIMSLNSFGGVFRVLGCLFICKGSKKLSQYNNSFLLLLYFSLLSLIFSAFVALVDVSAFLYSNLFISVRLFTTDITEILSYLKTAFDFLTVALICFSVRAISKETGAVKTQYTSVRNFVFYCVFFLLQFVVWLGSLTQSQALLEFISATALPIWMILVNLICIIPNCVMLFSCYARICDSNDTEMSVKQSRFAFVNRMRLRKADKGEENNE